MSNSGRTCTARRATKLSARTTSYRYRTARPSRDRPQIRVSAGSRPDADQIGRPDVRGPAITGATAAFEMVVNSFAEGDTETLQNLLSDEVYEILRRPSVIAKRRSAPMRRRSLVLMLRRSSKQKCRSKTRL